MELRHLWLTDFRSYATAELVPAPGLTAIVGPNGQGKTNLLEAVGYLATLSSFRGAPGEAMVRQGVEVAVVRAEVEREGRTALVEAELRTSGRDRVQVNRQPLRRTRDLLGTVRVTVFSPDDLALVKGGPGERRRVLDDTLVTCAPRHDATRSDLDRVLRQRGTLLKQAGGRLTDEVAATLDVWDAKLAELGEVLGTARARLVERLAPAVAVAYDQVASASAEVHTTYDPPWRREGLAAALARVRADDVRRGVSTVGPHRDDVVFEVNAMPARTHASQGEQRSLALALRLATHAVVTEITGSAPILCLDDVFSELDPDRSSALLAHLPPGQALLTTAGPLPAGTTPDLTVQVGTGTLKVAA
ncbi:MAG TPA: DNA replication/repair protein RecF [Acidimicrobiales bacterium]|nr:DNA replication/repair protein RecF [Acidimicrobiales bacterium]